MSNADAPGAGAAASGSQQPPKPVQIAFVLWQGFSKRKLTGRRLSDVMISTVANEAAAVFP